MTVLDNIFLGRQPARRWGWRRRAASARWRRRCSRATASTLDLDAVVGDLPTVKQKEVEILKALALDARVLLMDEPTGWLAAADVAQASRDHPRAEGARRGHRLHQPHPRRDVRGVRHADGACATGSVSRDRASPT